MIGTATAIAISAIASGATSAYSINRSASVNNRSLDAQRESDRSAMQLEREAMAQQERARQEAVAIDKQRFDAYVAANTPRWEAGHRILGELTDMAGVGRGGGSFTPPTYQGHAPASGGPPPRAPMPQAGMPQAGMNLSDMAGRQPSRGLTAARSLMPMPMPQGRSPMDLLQLAQMAHGGSMAGQHV